MRILVVEDEKKLAPYIKKGLEENHFAIDVSHDGEEGLFMLNTNEYDLVILDILLPKKNGLEILLEARKNGKNIPILLLTAKDAVEDKAYGLDLGADDYLVNRLRNKIDKDRTHKLIHTIKGVGYVMKDEKP